MNIFTRGNAIIMWLLASIFYAYQYVLRVLPNIIMPDIMAKFSIDANVFGQFSGFYYIGYAAMHIPIGILFDRVGPRVVMSASMVMTAVGLLPLIYTDIWAYPVIGRALIGMGSSGAILGVFKIIRLGFAEEKFTRLLGISVTIGLLGAIYGGRPVNYFMQILGWEAVVGIMVLLGLVLAVATYMIVPSQHPESTNIREVICDVKSVLTNPIVLAICILGGMMVGPNEGFADVWGSEYLKSVYHMDADWAATLPSFIFLGMCFGSPLLTYIADKTKAYYGITIISAVVMASSFALLLSGQLNLTMMMILFSATGVMCAYQILVIYKASTYVEEKNVGLTTACVNMIIMLFGYVFHGSIGRLMNLFWDGTQANGVPVYSSEAFTNALLIIPVGLLVGAIGFTILSMKDRRKRKCLQTN